MKVTEYRFVGRWEGHNAKPVGDCLKDLEGRLGRGPTKAEIVKEAGPARSPLHKFFTWNDGQAARLYRQWEAGDLVRHLRVRIVEVGPDQKEREVRGWFAVYQGEDNFAGRQEPRPFIRIAEILADGTKRKELLREAVAEFEALREKYETLSELDSVFAALDAVIEDMT